MPGRSIRRRLPTRSREVAKFIIATSLSLDVLLTGFSRWGSSPSVRPGLVSFLEGWDIAKAGVATMVMSAIALRARSLSLWVFAALFGLITMLDGTGAHCLVAVWILIRLGLDPDASTAGAPTSAYGELVILTSFSVLAAVAIWATRNRDRDLAFVRRHLLMILVALWVFAVAIDFLVEVWGSPRWRSFEESGERGIMSILLGYVLGLLVTPPSKTHRISEQIQVASPP